MNREEDTLRVKEEEKAMIQDLAERMKGFETEQSSLIPILQMIQERYAYLSAESIEMVARHLRMAPCEVYGVATFYNQFRFQPPGRHPIKVCLGTACHVRGGDIILENFERKLGISDGETSPDREYSIERVACVGCCALAPVAVVDEVVQAHMAPSKVEGIILGFELEKQKGTVERQENDVIS